MLGLTIGAAEAISLDGMTLLAVDVDGLVAQVSSAGVDAVCGAGSAGVVAEFVFQTNEEA
uniref:Uncharacterized protein n=1 Tax=Romanomermis culicivorax TaxID=13658 RepID=A0A915JAD2_ROMCU